MDLVADGGVGGAGDTPFFPTPAAVDMSLRVVEVLGLPLHSVNKLLFWPRRLLWARAVAALAGKSWEGGGAALAERAWGNRGSAKTSYRLPPRPRSTPPRPGPRPPPPPHGRGSLRPPTARRPVPRDWRWCCRPEAGSYSFPARKDLHAPGLEVLPVSDVLPVR